VDWYRTAAEHNHVDFSDFVINTVDMGIYISSWVSGSRDGLSSARVTVSAHKGLPAAVFVKINHQDKLFSPQIELEMPVLGNFIEEATIAKEGGDVVYSFEKELKTHRSEVVISVGMALDEIADNLHVHLSGRSDDAVELRRKWKSWK